MRITHLKRDFYALIYNKIFIIEENISNQYLDNFSGKKIQLPYITLKTSVYMDNVGTQMVAHRMGDIRIIVYDDDYETMCNTVSSITSSLETMDNQLYLTEYNEDDGMLEIDGRKPYYTAIDVKVNLYPDGASEV